MAPSHIQQDPRYQQRRNRALNLPVGFGSKYVFTAEGCNCPDAQYRAPEGWCKHRIAADIEEAWFEADHRNQLLNDPTLGGLYPA